MLHLDYKFKAKKYENNLRNINDYEGLSDKKFYDKFIIMDYKKLKGVFNDSLYPLIFYHNSDIILKENELLRKELLKDANFDETFDYDEQQMFPIVKNYFLRKISIRSDNENEFLNSEMYDSKIAIEKIIKSKYLYNKLDYLESICPLEGVNKTNNKEKENLETSKIELHCTIVCCDIEGKRILISKKSENYKTNPKIWDFGSSEAEAGEKLIVSIKKQYKERFDIDIELYEDLTRLDVQPVPLNIYEIKKYNNKKGVIFVAKVLNEDKESIIKDFKSSDKYVELKWIRKEDLKQFKDEDLIDDFKHTANKVFDNMDKWFPEGEDNE